MKRPQKGEENAFQTTTYTRYPYAVLACDCASHFILAVVTGRGPEPDDPNFRPAVRQLASRTRVETLLADAGFDSEAANAYARGKHGQRTIIPATRGRPTSKLPRGRWRRVMHQRFPQKKIRPALAGGNRH